MSEGAAGFVLVVSGPSGAGKSTLTRAAMERLDSLRFSVSYTTRAPRVGEEDGVDYFFVDRPTFEGLRAEGRLAEWAEVHGNLYGTSLDFLNRETARGVVLLLDIDSQGARQIKAAYPDAVLVFFLPPSVDTLRQRLVARGTDRPEVIERRLGHAQREMAEFSWYDYVIVNDEFEGALDRLIGVVRAEGCRPTRQAGVLARILAEDEGLSTAG